MKNKHFIVAPVCKTKEVTIIGASIDESVKIRCEVEADPNEVDFVWEFNNSGENFELAPAKFDGNNGTTSEFVYTPMSERDYGALTCWGRNAIGKQKTPCVYQVIPAGMHNLILFLFNYSHPILYSIFPPPPPPPLANFPSNFTATYYMYI